MKFKNGLGNPTIEANVTDKGYCKIIFDSCGTITKAFVGPPNSYKFLVYSIHDSDSDSCLIDAMKELFNISPSDFIEMFKEMKADNQITYAKEIAISQKNQLIEEANQMFDLALKLEEIVGN